MSVSHSMDSPRLADGGQAADEPRATAPRSTMVIAGPGKPPEPELRARIAGDAMPDVVSAEDAIGAVVVDDRHFARQPGLRGRLLRRLPLLVAQAIEAWQRGREFDAVLTWGDRPAILIGAVMCLRRRRPAHVAILMWPSKTKKAALLRRVLRGIDTFIVWPPLQRRFVEERLGVPARQFVDAYAPVDVRFWRPQGGAGDMICSVGQEMRDYGTLLDALRGLSMPCHIAAGTGMFNTRFLDGEWRENVGDQALPDNVTVGRRTHAELRELYARSRFVVVPLRPSDMDNGVTVILEAFAMGKAVICTQTDGQTGLLEHDVNCLRVPPGDPEALRAAILELWNDPDRCARLGAAGRRIVKDRHNLDGWRATLLCAVEQAIAARREPRPAAGDTEPVRLPSGRRVRSMVVTSRQGKPAQSELRRLIAADLLPNSVSADDAIGATFVDDRYLAEMPGLRGRLLRRAPFLIAQALVILVTAGRYDAIVTWGERHSLMVAAVLRVRRALPLARVRAGHVAILMWPSKRNPTLLRLLFSRIDRFIVWPPLQRRYTEEELEVPAQRFVDVHAPVDTDFWRPMEGAGDLICAPGQEMRDYATLLEALRDLAIPCHIAAGQGLFHARFLSEDWQTNVGERTIPANITLGRKPHPELRELYARSRFVVVPLRPSEMDNGITVITEAFAMGKAVICTDSPGQTGLLEPGVNCLRVPPGDPQALRAAIVELWNDPERCAQMGAAGRRAVEERHNLAQWRAALASAVRDAASVRAR